MNQEEFQRNNLGMLGPNGEVIPCTNFQEWARWVEENWNNRHVAFDEIEGFAISTVFLVANHNFGSGPGIWFETMVFRSTTDPTKFSQSNDYEQRRYSTRDEALAGHKKICAMVRAGEIGE